MKKKLIIIFSVIISLIMMTNSFAKVTFSDVEGTKYEKAVNALVEKGVINGMEDGTFRPNKNVTRAQIAKMIALAFDLRGTEELDFSDFDNNHWSVKYVKMAVKNKIVKGYPEGTFKPEKNVTYAEATTMLLRAAGLEDNELKNGTWPIEYMEKAEELNIFDGVKNYSNNAKATRGDIALMIYNLLNIDETQDEIIDNKDEELVDNLKDENSDVLPEKITNMGVGDINCDGSIDKNDLKLLKMHVNSGTALSSAGLKNADLNADMKVDEKDISVLERYLLGEIILLPYTKENPIVAEPQKENETNNKAEEEDKTTPIDTNKEDSSKKENVTDKKIEEDDKTTTIIETKKEESSKNENIDKKLNENENTGKTNLANKITNLGVGDVNCDGSINKNDLKLLKMYVINGTSLSSAGLKNADLNADMKVDEKDISVLERYLSGEIILLPYTKENPIIAEPQTKKEVSTDTKGKTEVKNDTISSKKGGSSKINETVKQETLKRKPDAELPVQPKPILEKM